MNHLTLLHERMFVYSSTPVSDSIQCCEKNYRSWTLPPKEKESKQKVLNYTYCNLDILFALKLVREYEPLQKSSGLVQILGWLKKGC